MVNGRPLITREKFLLSLHPLGVSLGWGREDEKERESLFSLHALMEGWENEFCVRVALENYSARASDCGGIHITATKKVVSAMREGIASLGDRPEMTSAKRDGLEDTVRVDAWISPVS